jgi:hypothetical protein
VEGLLITSDCRLMRSLQASGALAMLKYRFEVAGQVLSVSNISWDGLMSHDCLITPTCSLFSSHIPSL